MNPYSIKEIGTVQEMLKAHAILKELYPDLSLSNYETMLTRMVPMNYKQLWVLDESKIVGLSGFWIGTKIWCGKYLELDNVIVAQAYRSKGIGKLMTDFLKNKAIKEDCNMLALDAYTDNFPAIKFYMNEGYIPRGFHMLNKLKENYHPH